MAEENISLRFWLKNIKLTRNYFLNQLIRNELISKKHKKLIQP